MATFGKRDLALLLPSDVGETLSRRPAPQEETQKYEPPKPRLDPSKKVARYWAGKGPKEALSEEDEEEFEALASKKANAARVAPEVIPTDDSRLRRLQQSKPQQGAERRRRIIEAEVIVAHDEEAEKGGNEEFVEGDILPGEQFEQSEEDEEEIADRRARIKERLKHQAELQHESITAEVPSAIKKEVETSESEYETASEESSEEEQLLKPVFVPKSKRDTIREAELKAAEEEAKIQRENAILEERKQQTRAYVAESLRRQEEAKETDKTDNDSESGLPDDTDGLDEALEYESWKVREMGRIKREFEEREEIEREKADIERRRNMTDEERMAEDEANGRFKEKEKRQWKFMQKYYHKGVFYMDESSVKSTQDARAKEYDAPTGEDLYNREALPKVLQVKNFGKRGRTKWTHLVAEDTTKWDNPWFQRSELREKYNAKMAGVGEISVGKRKKPRQG